MTAASKGNGFGAAERLTRGRAHALLEAFSKSGKPLSEFAREHGYEPQRLYEWRRRLRTPEATVSAPAFVPVEVRTDEANPPTTSSIEIVLRNGRSLRVGAKFDVEAVCRLVHVLEREVASC